MPILIELHRLQFISLHMCVQDLLADLAGTHSHNEFSIEKRVPLHIDHMALNKVKFDPHNDSSPPLSLCFPPLPPSLSLSTLRTAAYRRSWSRR